MEEMRIKIGIKTDGDPEVRREGENTVVSNMLIGDGFHWEHKIEAILPGEVKNFCRENEDRSHDSERYCNEDADLRVTLVNELPIETYLECVVGSEMNPRSPEEFLKAHAVISRSWALGKLLKSHSFDDEGKVDSPSRLVGWDDTGSHRGFDVCSDDHCQRYQGIQAISPEALKAIHATAGDVLTAPDGSLVDARFSKCCGGRTELFETCWQPRHISCLESIDDPWCNLSDLRPYEREKLLSSTLKDYDRTTEGYGYSWKAKITKEEIRNNLWRKFGRDIGGIYEIEPAHRGTSGRIDLIRLHGSMGSLDFGKELWIRRLLSDSHLYSSKFEVIETDNILILEGKGWGHGVGLCQIGAANMAMNGYGYREILEFYYPGATIGKWY